MNGIIKCTFITKYLTVSKTLEIKLCYTQNHEIKSVTHSNTVE